MKASDYIAKFIADQGVRHAFVITGGCIVHAIDSLSKRDDIKYIPVQHEQAGAMAADCYSRINGNLGVAMATSGPGATNLLTGVCCSYYDSIPVLLVTGQVPSSQLKKGSKSRQIGFQETDVVSIFNSVTKYSKLIDSPNMLRYEMEKAVYLAREGRPGPVLLDICDDVQRADINPDSLPSFLPPNQTKNIGDLENKIDESFELLGKSERPVVILGGGIRLSGTIDMARYFVEKLGFPVVPTWAGMDYIPYSNPLVVGSFGVSSERAGNFAVQNSDLVIALGTRLDTHETGPNSKTFARGAKKIMVDIDESELEKYGKSGLQIDFPIQADLRDFFGIANRKISDVSKLDISPWKEKISQWKSKYLICSPSQIYQAEKVNPYFFMDGLSRASSDREIVITDAGANLTWTMQGFRTKGTQRLISAFNHSPMGYSLPASIGAALASDRPVTCIIGDGGIQMNVQELATLAYNNLPVKIFLMNNHGHGIIKQTLDAWLGSRYNSVDSTSGLPDPNFEDIAKAYGLQVESIKNHSELEKLNEICSKTSPILCNVEVAPRQRIEPKLTWGRPIEDPEPLMEREQFNKEMIVPPLS